MQTLATIQGCLMKWITLTDVRTVEVVAVWTLGQTMPG